MFARRSVYLTSVRPILEYAQLAWSGLSATDSRKLERLQRRAARLITGERLGEQSRGNIEHDGEGKEKEEEGKGERREEKGKGNLEVKLW